MDFRCFSALAAWGKTLPQLDRFQVYPLQDQHEFPGGKLKLARGRPFKSALFQPLYVQSIPVFVPLEQPDLVACLSDKNKDIPTKGVLFQAVLDKPCKGIDAAPHITRPLEEEVPGKIID